MSSWFTEHALGSDESLPLNNQAPHVMPEISPTIAQFKFAEAYIIDEASMAETNGDVHSISAASMESSTHEPTIPEDDEVDLEDEKDVADFENGNNSPAWEPEAFDLRPPAPSISTSDGEFLAKRLFSIEHLKILLNNHAMFTRLTHFLKHHNPDQLDLLVQYLESQKAIKAAQYANAIAQRMKAAGSDGTPSVATNINEDFAAAAQDMEDRLVTGALCSYITHLLTAVVTECLVKEIIGSNTPIMQELVSGLAEVYCMTDPGRHDNPIVYCSEEFTRQTQYGRNYVLGRNCRFLQGPETSKTTVERMRKATEEGHEVSETLLNYRRDGSPFINLVLVAPLYDNLGKLRYYVGCQIDVTHLVDGGKGLPSFRQLLAQEQESHWPPEISVKEPIKKLKELGKLFTEDELAAIHDPENRSPGARQHRRVDSLTQLRRSERKYIGIDDALEDTLWPSARFGHSGRLPGVYKNYVLVRPWPALTIVFTSASLRIPGLVQSNLLDRIAGSPHTRQGVQEAFRLEVGVTARIGWMSGRSANISEAKPRWIHCTPLLGSDGRVGVWMVVIVEKEQITGHFKSQMYTTPDNLPNDAAKEKMEASKMYADYVRRQGTSVRQADSLDIAPRSATTGPPVRSQFAPPPASTTRRPSIDLMSHSGWPRRGSDTKTGPRSQTTGPVYAPFPPPQGMNGTITPTPDILLGRKGSGDAASVLSADPSLRAQSALPRTGGPFAPPVSTPSMGKADGAKTYADFLKRQDSTDTTGTNGVTALPVQPPLTPANQSLSPPAMRAQTAEPIGSPYAPPPPSKAPNKLQRVGSPLARNISSEPQEIPQVLPDRARTAGPERDSPWAKPRSRMAKLFGRH